MYQKTIFSLLIFLLFITKNNAQEITGTWLATDSSRVYSIYATANGYEAKLDFSAREDEKPGTFILKGVKQVSQKNKYKGVIYAVDDGMAANVKISLQDAHTLRLTIERLFIFPLTLYWHKAGKNIAATAEPSLER